MTVFAEVVYRMPMAEYSEGMYDLLTEGGPLCTCTPGTQDVGTFCRMMFASGGPCRTDASIAEVSVMIEDEVPMGTLVADAMRAAEEFLVTLLPGSEVRFYTEQEWTTDHGDADMTPDVVIPMLAWG